MRNWQNNRNYRKIRQLDGTIKNIIIVDGDSIEVTDTVFTAYSKMDRRTRYLDELYRKIPHVSLEKLLESGVPIDLYTDKRSPSSEEIAIKNMDKAKFRKLLSKLPKAVRQLTEEEQRLIQALYFERISIREYARLNGVYHHAIAYRRDKILKKLKTLLELND